MSIHKDDKDKNKKHRDDRNRKYRQELVKKLANLVILIAICSSDVFLEHKVCCHLCPDSPITGEILD